MLSETIWSNNNTSPVQSSNHQFQTVLDNMDPEVAKVLANPKSGIIQSEGRRLSFNDGSDIDGMFSFKKGSLSAITAPVGYSGGNGVSQRLNFGTASISGGIANRHPPQDSFLQKFSSVADATREIELSNGLGKLNLEEANSNRNNVNNDNSMKPFMEVGILSSPHNSLNENLNMPVPRTSRHQSISEKIDNYNNNSPVQASATLSISSDLNSNANDRNNNHNSNHNFWNPATATSFTPTGSYNYFMDGKMSGIPLPPPPQQGFTPYGQNTASMPAINPPFMIPSPPPPFMDPSLYNMVNYGVNDALEKDPAESEVMSEAESKSKDDNPKGQKVNSHIPGIGLRNQIPSPAGFMFQSFNPYPIYQQSLQVVSNGSTKSTPTEKHQNSNSAAFEPPVNTKRKNPRSGNKGANHIYRSPLLEEVRSNFKGKEYFLKDIYGHAVEFTKDQFGSRFIQQKLPESSEEEKEVIFNEIRDISYELMTDVFGNYVIQKYFEFGSTTQRKVLLEAMIGHIYELSLQMYGCRVVQRALEAIDLTGQLQIINELREYILICAKDQNGNHVIQKSIEKIPFSKIEFILENLDNQIYHLSTHPYGCRVIQRLLEHSNIEDQKKILSELNRFIFYLIQDQYGNYVMQHILERGHEEDRKEILDVVLGSVVNFSKHKFASNVIEKCIKFGTLEQRKQILREVMVGNENSNIETVSDDSPLALMMKDQYANYVIQKLVEGFDAKSEEKKMLVLKLRQYLKQISSKNSYGKHLASVEKMIIVAETALLEAENN